MNGKKILIGLAIVFGMIMLYAILNANCVFGHDWKKANCTQPQTCRRCGKTTGKALGHKFSKATCEQASKCSICGTVEGKPLNHKFIEATCTEAPKCELCGKTEGKALGHDVEYDNTVKAATCVEDGEKSGVCKRCGETLTQTIPATGTHTYVWDKEIAPCQSGFQKGKCSVCGKEESAYATKTAEHQYGEWKEVGITEGFFSDTLYKQLERTCSVCGEVDTDLQEVSYNEILEKQQQEHEANKQKLIKGLQLTVLDTYQAGSYWHVKWRIKNSTGSDVTYVKFKLSVLDASGNVITSKSNDAAEISPYGSALPNGESIEGNFFGMSYSGSYSSMKFEIIDAY